jgi:hypothetical protein
MTNRLSSQSEPEKAAEKANLQPRDQNISLIDTNIAVFITVIQKGAGVANIHLTPFLRLP